MEHGTISYYTRKKCRCSECKEAMSLYQRENYRKKKGGTVRAKAPAQHGTMSYYTGRSCRCDLCKQACTDYYQIKNYGVTSRELLEAQGGKCASCSNITSGSRKGWHVDHDHTTGKVRGVLCYGCNVALGMLGEDLERIEALAFYLRAHA